MNKFTSRICRASFQEVQNKSLLKSIQYNTATPRAFKFTMAPILSYQMLNKATLFNINYHPHQDFSKT